MCCLSDLRHRATVPHSSPLPVGRVRLRLVVRTYLRTVYVVIDGGDRGAERPVVCVMSGAEVVNLLI